MKKIFLLLLIIIFSCNNDQEILTDITEPVLTEPPVNLSNVTSIIEFGAVLGPGRLNPAFEYNLDSANVDVISCSDGIVKSITLNNNFADYEIFVIPSPLSGWTIIYDHVLDLKIEEGDYIQAGDIIGKVGVGARTELQINYYSNNDEISYCPFNFANDYFIQSHKNYTANWCLINSVEP